MNLILVSNFLRENHLKTLTYNSIKYLHLKLENELQSLLV